MPHAAVNINRRGINRFISVPFATSQRSGLASRRVYPDITVSHKSNTLESPNLLSGLHSQDYRQGFFALPKNIWEEKWKILLYAGNFYHFAASVKCLEK